MLDPVVLGLDGLFVLAVAYDFARTPRPDRATVARTLPERVGLSRDFVRHLRIELPRANGLRIAVHEEFPRPFEVRARTVDDEVQVPPPDDPSGGPDVGQLSSTGAVELRRTYRSTLRGPFALGDVRLRVRGALGLVERQARLQGEQSVAVEPALANLRQTLRLAASERWEDLGVRLLRRRGGETEFESIREYVHGDDVRRVDWKAFARRGKPMVRQYEVERGQELIILVDRGRRMRATTAEGRRRGWTKLDWALDATLELAAVALSKGDRVGVAAFDHTLSTYVAPAKGDRQLPRLSQALFHLQPTSHDPDLARALQELAVRHRRRATVIIVSDVADPYSAPTQGRALAAASRRHAVVFAALDDPALRAAAEGHEDAAVRAAALELAQDRRVALRSLAASGARILDALPADAAAPMLAAWLEERRGF